jgi:hypothetical protein
VAKKPTNKQDPFGGNSYLGGLGGQQDKERVDNRPAAATYRIGDLRDEINDLSAKHNVEKSSLVRVLLRYAIDGLNNGEWALPLDEAKPPPRKLD